MVNWFRRLALRIARAMNPRLDRVIRTGGGTVDTLMEQNAMLREYARTQEQERRSDVLRMMEDYREAVFMAGGGWLPRIAARESASAVGTNVKDDPRFQIEESDSAAIVQCKERLLELELALEDRSWKRMEAQARFEFSRWGIQQIILICRLYRIKNPVIQRGILVSTYYVFARGLKVGCDDEDANAVIQACFSDPRNATELSLGALAKKNDAKYTDGNIFWTFFVDPEDGQTLIRHIDPIEIEEIFTDPNDSSIPWYYHRRWTEQTFDARRGVLTPTPRDQWYVALGYEPPEGAATTIGGKPLAQDDTGRLIPVYHRREGELENWLFGCPRAYAALDWARAWRESLEDYCSRIRALSRYGYDVETKGGPPAIAGMKQQMATTLANDLESIEQQPPPVTGSMWVHGPGTKMTPMRTGGLSETPEQGMPILHMAQMVFGLPDTFFSDTQRGNLATAASLDRPTQLKFIFDQEIWKEDLSIIGMVILRNSMNAPKGKLRESLERRGIKPNAVSIEMQPLKMGSISYVAVLEAKKKPKTVGGDALTKIRVNVEFPAILEGDIPQRVNAIVAAMTLNGFSPIGIDQRVGVQLLLNELLSFGFEFDPDEILDAMFPDKTYDPDRTKPPEPPPAAPGAPALPPGSPAPAPAPKAKPRTAAQEARLEQVLGNLQRVLKMQEARLRTSGRV